MSAWMIIGAALVLVAGIIAVLAYIASSRHQRLREVHDDTADTHIHMVLAPASSHGLMNEWRYRQYQRLSQLYRVELD